MSDNTRILQCKNCGHREECSPFLRPYMCWSCGVFPQWEEVGEPEILTEDEVKERLSEDA